MGVVEAADSQVVFVWSGEGSLEKGAMKHCVIRCSCVLSLEVVRGWDAHGI
jgi:hypothetical protein